MGLFKKDTSLLDPLARQTSFCADPFRAGGLLPCDSSCIRVERIYPDPFSQLGCYAP